MVRLTILRHAKSSWAEPGGSDIDRVLNDKGHEQTVRLAKWLESAGEKPDACICSPAQRTRLTWDGIAAPLGSITPEFRERLYSGNPETYLDEIWASEASHLLLIGHNPTCDELVRTLARPTGPAYERLAADHYGTANWATLRFDGDDMSAVALARGTLEHYVRPSDLSD